VPTEDHRDLGNNNGTGANDVHWPASPTDTSSGDEPETQYRASEVPEPGSQIIQAETGDMGVTDQAPTQTDPGLEAGTGRSAIQSQ